MTDPHELGRWGENTAAEYLESKGFRILARNWRTRRGEIDLVAQIDQVLAFVEVKTRRGTDFGKPEEAITDVKAGRLLALGQEYVVQNELLDVEWRIDLIAIELEKNGSLKRLEHIPNVVFGW